MKDVSSFTVHKPEAASFEVNTNPWVVFQNAVYSLQTLPWNDVNLGDDRMKQLDALVQHDMSQLRRTQDGIINTTKSLTESCLGDELSTLERLVSTSRHLPTGRFPWILASLKHAGIAASPQEVSVGDLWCHLLQATFKIIYYTECV